MILRRGILTVLVQLVQIAALAAITILVTRVTGAHGRGIYTLASSVAIIASTLSGLGISWASVYYLGRHQFELDRVVATLLAASAGTAAVAMAGVAIVYLVFRNTYFHDLDAQQAVVMVALTGFLQIATSVASIVLGTNRPQHYAALSALQVAVAFTIQLGLAGAGSLSATSALVALACGAATSVLLGLYFVSRTSPLRLGFDALILRTFFGFGVRGYAADLLMLLIYRLDSLIVNGLRGIVSVGYYSVASAMAETLTYGAYGLALVMFPHVSSLERKEADRVTPVVCRNVVFITFVGAAGMLLVSRELVILVFGPAMNPALPPLWLLLPGVVAMSAFRILASYLNGIGKPHYVTYIAGGGVALTAVLDVALIPPYGIAGAAVASSVVYIATMAAAVRVFTKESGAAALETLVIQPADIQRYGRLAEATMRRVSALWAARA